MKESLGTERSPSPQCITDAIIGTSDVVPVEVLRGLAPVRLPQRASHGRQRHALLPRHLHGAGALLVLFTLFAA